MSFDLGVWHLASGPGAARAGDVYGRLCEGDLSDVIPHPSVAAFLEEITERFPQIDEWPEETIDDCPWNVAFDVSDAHVLMCIAWSRCEEVAPWILEVARKHHLFLYDPQSDELHAPS